MAWMKGRAPHRWQMQSIDVDAPFRVQIEENPGAPLDRQVQTKPWGAGKQDEEKQVSD